MPSATAVPLTISAAASPSRKPPSQAGDSALAVAAERRQPMAVVVAPTGGGAHRAPQPLIGDRAERAAPAIDECAQRRFAGGRDQQRRGRLIALPALCPAIRPALFPAGRRGEHDMRVGAAKAERVDPGIVLPAGARQRLGRAQQAQIERFKRDIPARAVAVEGRRDHAALERQRRLEQPGHARGRLQMADIGLDRADRQRLAPPLADRPADRRRFDRVADRGPGAVHFEKRERLRIDLRLGVDRTQQRRLRGLARQRQADGAAVRIGPGGEDHGADRVTLGNRLGERLQDHDTGAFAADIAVGAVVKGKAAAPRRQHRGAAEADEWVGGEQQIDAADDGAGDPPGADRLAGVMQRHQGRRAGGVDGEARSAQVEDIGDAVGEDAQRIPGHEIRVGAGRVAQPQIGVVGRRRPDINPAIGAGEAARRDPGIFARVPHELQQQPLLRVHLHRLARRDPKERRFELGDLVDQTGRPSIALAGLATSGMIEKSGRPSLRADLRDRIPAAGEQAPELLEAVASGKSAGCADDRDRTVRHGNRRHGSRRAAPVHQLPPFVPSWSPAVCSRHTASVSCRSRSFVLVDDAHKVNRGEDGPRCRCRGDRRLLAGAAVSEAVRAR